MAASGGQESENGMERRDTDDNRHELDRAVAGRLAKLRTMPVDTSKLDAAILTKIPRSGRDWRIGIGWFRPFRATAASVTLLAVLAAVLLSTSGGPAIASPARMAGFHRSLALGETPATRVTSIEAANKILVARWPQSPLLPAVPQDHVTACCMKSVRDKRLACVLLRRDGVPVTMTVANASDMKLPKSPTIGRGGVTYHVQSFEQVNMIMTEQGSRWVCLVSELSVEQLIDIAQKLQF